EVQLETLNFKLETKIYQLPLAPPPPKLPPPNPPNPPPPKPPPELPPPNPPLPQELIPPLVKMISPQLNPRRERFPPLFPPPLDAMMTNKTITKIKANNVMIPPIPSFSLGSASYFPANCF